MRVNPRYLYMPILHICSPPPQLYSVSISESTFSPRHGDVPRDEASMPNAKPICRFDWRTDVGIQHNVHISYGSYWNRKLQDHDVYSKMHHSIEKHVVTPQSKHCEMCREKRMQNNSNNRAELQIYRNRRAQHQKNYT